MIYSKNKIIPLLGLFLLISTIIAHHLLIRNDGLPNYFEIYSELVTHSYMPSLIAFSLSLGFSFCLYTINQGGIFKFWGSVSLGLLISSCISIYASLLIFESYFDFQPIPLDKIPSLISNSDYRFELLISLALGFLPLVSLLLTYLLKDVFREKTFGDAKFASALDVVTSDFVKKTDESIIIAKKNGVPLYSNGFEHVLCFAPTGSGKTTSISIPNLLNYPYSVVANDVKLSLYKTTSRYRTEVLGHKCYVWSLSESNGFTHRYNPFSLISSDKHQRIADIQRIAHIFIPDNPGKDDIWTRTSRGLFKAMVLYMLDTPNTSVTLGELNRLMKKAKFNDWLNDILMGTEDLDDEFYRNGFAYIEQHEKTRNSIKMDLESRFELFDDPYIDAATSDSDFDLRNLRKEKITIYVAFSDDDMERLSPLLTLFWQQLISCMIHHMPCPKSEPYPLLCLIDEFSSLGRIERLRRSLKLLREYRVRCILMMQYIAQTYEKYSQNEAKAFTNIKTKIAFASDDIQDAEFISKLLGTKTQKVCSGSFSSQHRGESITKSYNFQAMPLMRADQIMRMSQSRALILRTGSHPIKSSQYRWYKDRTMRQLEYEPLPLPKQEIKTYRFDHLQKHADDSQPALPGPFNEY